MANERINLRKELNNYKIDFDLLQKTPCTTEENKEYEELLKNGGTLPDGVFAYTYGDEESTSEFYTVYESDLSEAEIQEYLTYKQLSMIKTIKNCVLFFTVLTIIGMIAYFLLSMSISISL